MGWSQKGQFTFRVKVIRSGECMGKEGTHYKRAFLRRRGSKGIIYCENKAGVTGGD